MSNSAPVGLNLARRLIVLEAARDPATGPLDAAVRACEKLRVPLVKLTGAAGFRSLLTRAMTLATVRVPWLAAVQVRADGTLEGFDAAWRQRGADEGVEAGVEVVAQLIGLLMTFIGEPLTLRLVRDAWPDAPIDEMDRQAEGQP